MSIRPQPLNKDLVSRIYVSSITPTSLEAAADAGLGLMIIPQKPWDDHIKDLNLYNSKRIQKGLDPRNPVVGCFMYCSDNEAELKQAREEYMPNMNFSATRHYEFDEPEHFRNTKGYEAYAVSADAINSGDARAHQDDTQVIGTPEECLEKLRSIQQATKPIEMFGMVRFGGMPQEKTRRSLELFAKEVLPALHKDPVLDPATTARIS
jgi:alkanesulfonate monooxygenase SsuD/methylene tetrahydromethanopterin reductase-like flavin-dependent oxidoreductase (luciferase family)